ncbi:MAG: M14 family metallopeptidase, partial [Ferruginibacter sp.]|nr:M14 family metallopeptidase [Ferruginibacter sp.]
IKIEEIRKNNLRLSGLLKDKRGDVNAPSVVWLCYNVHGNETSSSEVSMKVLYEILSGKNASLNEWMKNTVVIIDPCLNPDGRERYVNWLTQMSGKFVNANVDAREHDEPWPGGRTNHYNFDLNRDWAWQTQIESQTRLAKYQQWMPQIHCDFHEQSPNSPYYFAPAAEPVHEAVTQWQKDFQVTVGKNHAKYFDANGWLFFTKQYFDLFYPSYGDTYPLFNGGIGMTYEQAGSGRGGVAIALNNGDTLTLADRIDHHFATSISTIEIASLNSQKLLSNFKKYFDESISGSNNIYKSYVVANRNSGNISALKNLLKKNEISFGFATSNSNLKGYDYFSGKEENFSLQKNDLVINAAQPKAALLKVLFEPQPKLSDSATYDITAWALPYAYGLQTYATKENIAATINDNITTGNAVANYNAYGYVVAYRSFNETKLVSALLDENVKLRFAETAFIDNNIRYNEGSLLILRRGNEDKINKIISLLQQFKTDFGFISSGFSQQGFDAGSDKIRTLKNPKVALITGDGVSSAAAGEVWHLFDQELNKKITLINANEFDNADLKNYNVIILPDGYYKFLTNKDAASTLKQWIR